MIYDCLFPYTVGGAERWYRRLSQELVDQGHQVTYLTRKQWPDDDPPRIEGVEVIGVSPGGALYTDDGRRTFTSPLRFAAGVFRHLLRNRYDVIHVCAFPYFPLISVALAAPRTMRGVEWQEVWTRSYWRSYLGPARGLVGWLVQRLCIRLTPLAFVFHDLQARRLREEHLHGPLVRLGGLYDGETETEVDPSAPRDPLVVFAGRHIPEKRAPAVPPAVAAARRRVPGLRGIVIGDGPERPEVLRAIRAAGVESVVEAPGFVTSEEVADAFRRASCHFLPSVREGYGMVVVEAAAVGTPSVVVREPDNAAAELVKDGVNGYVAENLAAVPDAIARVHDDGAELRVRTREWFTSNARLLSATESARVIAATYDEAKERQWRG